MLQNLFSLFYPGRVVGIEYAASFLDVDLEDLAPLMSDLEKNELIQLINGGRVCKCNKFCKHAHLCSSINMKDARWILTEKGMNEYKYNRMYKLQYNLDSKCQKCRDFEIICVHGCNQNYVASKNN